MMIELTDHLVEGTSDRPARSDRIRQYDPLHLLPFNSPASFALFEYGRKLGAQRRKDQPTIS
jgi:hypothetical protein